MDNVEGYFHRLLTTVIAYKDNSPISTETIFSSLRHAIKHAQQLVNDFGDECNWSSNICPDGDSFLVNKNLDIEIVIRPCQVWWPK